MMSLLLENPWPIIGAGLVTEFVLGILLVTTRRGMLLGWMAGVAVVVVAVVVVEAYVVTDVERVQAELDGIEAALEANDLPAVLDHIHPSNTLKSAVAIRGYVKWGMGVLTIDEVHISGTEIKVDMEADPPTAVAEFDGYVKGTGDAIPYRVSPLAHFTVDYQLVGGRWLMVDYTSTDSQLMPGRK